MAGERYAKLTVRMGWSWNDGIRGAQTVSFRFRLAGAWVTLERGGRTDQFAVPDPDDGAGRDFVKQGVDNIRGLLQQVIQARGLSYSVSAAREVGNDPTNGGIPFDNGNPWPLIEFDIEANVYDSQYDLDFALDSAYGGSKVVSNQPTVRPVMVSVFPLPALIYGSATGSCSVLATNGSTGSYTYQWADEPTPRPNFREAMVGPRKYQVTVTDASGASTTVEVFIGSDPRLEVKVATTDTSITLLVSGGLPPYTYQWDDGPTTAVRTGLLMGTYACVVTDARGAQQRVVVQLVNQPYYWSRNPITLALDAGDDYRRDPTTKPNLSFLCEVWLEKVYLSGDFVQVGTTLEQPGDLQGRTVFDVQALLSPFLDYHVPAPTAAVPEQATPLFRRFYLQHAEQFGDPVLPTPVTSLEHHYVLLGGLNFYESQARTWFSRYQPTVKPFLSWEPGQKDVLADQPEFLYYQVQGGDPDFALQLRVGFSDNTQVVQPRAGATGVLPSEVYCVPVGYQALELAQLVTADRRVSWWEVWITDGQGVVRSQVRRFTLDERRFPRRRYLLYATSLGGMATYAAVGEAQVDAEVTGEQADLSLGPVYDPQAGDTLVQERALRPVTKLASGPRTQAQLDVSQDLLLSRRVLLLQGARWLPGYLKTKTSSVRDESKLVQVQELEFVHPTEHLYTPDL